MSDPVLANKDEIERFKSYIEIAKYAISICIALAAVCGVVIRIGVSAGGVSHWSAWLFGLGIIFNVAVFLASHRLVSEAAKGITHKLSTKNRDDLLAQINDRTYSFFVITFIGNLIYWSVAIGFVALL
jgi:hypothetical protein